MLSGTVSLTLGAAGLGCLFFGLLPAVLYRIVNAGVIALVVIGLLCLLECLLILKKRKLAPWEVFSGGGFAGVARKVIGVLLTVLLAAELVLSGLMIWGAGNRPADGDAVAVVLGCQTKNGQPSTMLENRLEQAIIYLESHPETMVVVTGGVDYGEPFTEAQVQAAWLEQRGIDPGRIIIENSSRDTRENLAYAADLIGTAGLGNRVVIFTDGFHQLRGQMYARLAGLEPRGIASGTPWGLLPCYWLREQAALCAAIAYPGMLAAIFQ